MENVKLNFVILCDNAFIDKDTNSLNLIGIFDRLSAKKFPAIHPRLMVVTNISGDIGEYKQLITIKNKNTGKKIVELPGLLHINKAEQKAQFIGKLFNMVFPEQGEYLIEIKINETIQNLITNFYVVQR